MTKIGMTTACSGMPMPTAKNVVSGPAVLRRARVSMYAAGADNATTSTDAIDTITTELTNPAPSSDTVHALP